MSDSSREHDNDSGDFWDWFENKPNSKKRRSQKHYHPIFLLVILTLLSAGLVGGGYYFLIQPPSSIISSRSQEEQSQKTASPAASLISSPTPAVTSTLDITILNGSGIRGQAAKTSTLIESLGYEDISVDNADEDSEDTIAEFSKDISKTARSEIVKKLETVYQNVIAKNLSSGSNKIIITTGKLRDK